MNAALVAADLDTIQRLSLPGALHVDRNGKAHPLTVWLDGLSRRPELRQSSRLALLTVSIIDEVAIVTGRSESVGSGPFFVTQVWLQVLGAWRRCAVRPATAIALPGSVNAAILPEI